MRARIVFSLAAMALATATAAEGQPAPHHTSARRPPKCAYDHRLVQVGACTAPQPWRCEPCSVGVRTLRINDKCGAPIQLCRRA